MSKITYKCPLVTAPLPLERHEGSPYAAENLFAKKHIQHATVATDVSLSYVVHEDPLASRSSVASETSSSTIDEARLVLVMGYGYTQEGFASFIDSIFRKWQQQRSDTPLKILTLDNRGCGGSDQPWGRYTTKLMARDTLALMTHIEWEKAHILGISMGGMIAMEMAALAPIRIQSLTLGATAASMTFAGFNVLKALLRTMLWPSAETETLMMQYLYPDTFLSTELDGKTVRDVITRQHVDGPLSNKGMSWFGSFGQTAALVTHSVSDARLKQIQDEGYPVLIVGGMKDCIILVDRALKMHQVMDGPNVETVIYEDAGHAIFVQHMEEMAQDLIDTIGRAGKWTTQA